MAGLRRIASRELRSGTVLTFSEGSVLEFVGDAFVNAANEGCTGGFGIDEHTNKSGGFKLKEARKAEEARQRELCEATLKSWGERDNVYYNT